MKEIKEGGVKGKVGSRKVSKVEMCDQVNYIPHLQGCCESPGGPKVYNLRKHCCMDGELKKGRCVLWGTCLPNDAFYLSNLLPRLFPLPRERPWLGLVT